MTNCRWMGTDRPRAVVGRHDADCDAEDCKGCAECPEEHCRVCGIAHGRGCAECLAETRGNLWEIVKLTGALPAEAIAKGVESEAAMLWGPATDWERWGHVQASIRVGRIPADWCEVADSERHPLYVLGSWDAMVRDVLEHEEPESVVTIGEAARYIDMQLTYLAGFADLPFEDMARDLRACVGHLEAVLHDGIQRDTGAPCMDCRIPLVREWGLLVAADGWRCPRCKEFRSDEDYRLNVAQVHAEKAEWLTAGEVEVLTGIKPAALRKRVERGDVKSQRDSGRTVYRANQIPEVVACRPAIA